MTDLRESGQPKLQRESPAGEQVISFVLAIVRTIDLTLGRRATSFLFYFSCGWAAAAHLCLCVTQIGGVLECGVSGCCIPGDPLFSSTQRIVVPPTKCQKFIAFLLCVCV